MQMDLSSDVEPIAMEGCMIATSFYVFPFPHELGHYLMKLFLY